MTITRTDENTFVWDTPEFEVTTWCTDLEGTDPAEVHLLIKAIPEITLLARFSGPLVLDDLILALTRHRNDVWPIDVMPLKSRDE